MTDQRPIPILLYHSIDVDRPKTYSRWVVTPACSKLISLCCKTRDLCR
jgi:hypothetical protein